MPWKTTDRTCTSEVRDFDGNRIYGQAIYQRDGIIQRYSAAFIDRVTQYTETQSGFSNWAAAQDWVEAQERSLQGRTA